MRDMKKRLIWLVMLAAVMMSCEQQESDVISKKRVLVTEATITEMEIWIDPPSGTTKWIPAFRGRWQDDNSIGLFAVDQYSHYGIHGFEFEEVYVYKLSVKESHYKEPPTEFLNTWYDLDKIISKEKAGE